MRLSHYRGITSSKSCHGGAKILHSSASVKTRLDVGIPCQRCVEAPRQERGFLFVLSIELFSRAVKKDATIKGIQVNKYELKISQYADDTTFFVRDLDSVTNLLNLLNDFNACSGLEINTSKTEAMWLGQWKERTDTPFGFKWPKEPISALGIFFSYNQASADSLNFGEKIKILEKTLKIWKRRNLTLYGRINIVKTLGLSKLIYAASVLAVPDHCNEMEP